MCSVPGIYKLCAEYQLVLLEVTSQVGLWYNQHMSRRINNCVLLFSAKCCIGSDYGLSPWEPRIEPFINGPGGTERFFQSKL
jgi:hypothetical protein